MAHKWLGFKRPIVNSEPSDYAFVKLPVWHRMGNTPTPFPRPYIILKYLGKDKVFKPNHESFTTAVVLVLDVEDNIVGRLRLRVASRVFDSDKLLGRLEDNLDLLFRGRRVSIRAREVDQDTNDIELSETISEEALTVLVFSAEHKKGIG